MKLVRMRELSRKLGIPRETFQRWIELDPSLAVWREGGIGGGSWWFKLDKLAEKAGLSLVDAYMLVEARWVKAVDLAAFTGTSRRTLAWWCKNRPRFGIRLGRNWYVDIDQMGWPEDQIDKVLEALRVGNPGSDGEEKQMRESDS